MFLERVDVSIAMSAKCPAEPGAEAAVGHCAEASSSGPTNIRLHALQPVLRDRSPASIAAATGGLTFDHVVPPPRAGDDWEMSRPPAPVQPQEGRPPPRQAQHADLSRADPPTTGSLRDHVRSFPPITSTKAARLLYWSRAGGRVQTHAVAARREAVVGEGRRAAMGGVRATPCLRPLLATPSPDIRPLRLWVCGSYHALPLLLAAG